MLHREYDQVRFRIAEDKFQILHSKLLLQKVAKPQLLY